jgi:hypothetical protein
MSSRESACGVQGRSGSDVSDAVRHYGQLFIGESRIGI